MKNFDNIEEIKALSPNELFSIDGGGMIDPNAYFKAFNALVNFAVGFGEGLREGCETAKQHWN